jgi:hypothetical protein
MSEMPRTFKTKEIQELYDNSEHIRAIVGILDTYGVSDDDMESIITMADEYGKEAYY